eukprot:CAMPEP_0174979522 /NCGR_PEP_ID=MMETSP0004_2-20121128/14830_1 /TAXON_ID=420556 /ORGANISM="Ochromonas sp., Strain CCMP1393" /LENGTH=63 /DNA_ID=CAMNT_0016231063 /DNA_START=68 /DNA_END=255 /DNA_ORIENTATION=+
MSSKRSPDEILTNPISKKARPELTEVESKIIFRGGNVVEWFECKDAIEQMFKVNDCYTFMCGG